jgi:F420H(2)-dependent quinone reductase
MPAEPSYRPSPVGDVRRQVEQYEATDGAIGGTHRGLPVVILTTRGSRTGAFRKTPLMKVEHAGSYAVVASSGGTAAAPSWYRNVISDPRVTLQDGPHRAGYVARELRAGSPEWTVWWSRAVAAFPRYAEYREQLSGTRDVPVVLLEIRPAAGAESGGTEEID